jgi:hypothetical protein
VKSGLVWLVLVACGDQRVDPHVCVSCADAVVAPDAPFCGVDQACSVLLQAGCTRGDKCTRGENPAEPTEGCIVCAPDGLVSIGSACTRSLARGMLVDNCVRGAICTGGSCKQICDNNGGKPTCDAGETCTSVDGLFADFGQIQPAGVCDPI